MEYGLRFQASDADGNRVTWWRSLMRTTSAAGLELAEQAIIKLTRGTDTEHELQTELQTGRSVPILSSA